MPEQILAAALAYVDLGFPIIPLCPPTHINMSADHRSKCSSPGKMPVIKNWTERGVPTREEVLSWFEKNPYINLGLILGRAGEEAGWNLVGIDIDSQEAEEKLEKASRGVLPDTWEFSTGKGRRLMYMLPEGAASKKFKFKAKEGELAFIADGQQTVLPPSIHSSGREYTWAKGKDPGSISIADAPQWLINKVVLFEEDGKELSPPVQHVDWKRTITEGERNTHLTKLAGSLLARGAIPGEQVITFLRAWNDEHCDPPLDEAEIVQMVNTLAESERVKRAQRRKNSKNPLRPVPVAQDIIQDQSNAGYSWKYSATRGMFYRCDETVGPWEPVENIFVQKLVREFIVEEDEAWDRMNNVNEVVNAMREMLADESEADLFDLGGASSASNKNFVFTPTGTLDWRERKLLPWDPKSYSTVQLPVEWNPEAINSKGYQTWIMALREWIPDEDTITFLQEYVGYCLVPDCGFRTAVFLYGGGSNGKSLFLDVIAPLFGTHISFIPLHRIAERFETVGLLDKLVNVCGDIDPRFLNETSVLKAAIGGDKLRAEYKYGRSFHFTPTARFIFSANTLPRSRDKTFGWYSRWRFVEFPHCFETDPKYRDDLLNVMSQPESLSGLLHWAVEGLERLYRNGKFTDSYSMKMAKAQYRAENDNVVAFAETTLNTIDLEVLNGMEKKERPKPLALSILYQMYGDWCSDQGLKATGRLEFTKRIGAVNGIATTSRVIRGRAVSYISNAEIDEHAETAYNIYVSLSKTLK